MKRRAGAQECYRKILPRRRGKSFQSSAGQSEKSDAESRCSGSVIFLMPLSQQAPLHNSLCVRRHARSEKTRGWVDKNFRFADKKAVRSKTWWQGWDKNIPVRWHALQGEGGGGEVEFGWILRCSRSGRVILRRERRDILLVFYWCESDRMRWMYFDGESLTQQSFLARRGSCTRAGYFRFRVINKSPMHDTNLYVHASVRYSGW